MTSIIGSKEFVDGRVYTKIIYNDLISINQNKTSQVKSKFKLCMSLSSVVDGIIDGRIFGVSATKLNWHDTVECSIVCDTDYSRCSSPLLKSTISAYTADKMEVLGYDELRSKIEDSRNGFREAARLGNTKYKEVVNLFDKYINYEPSPSPSVLAIKTLVSTVEEVDPSILGQYGISLKD